MICRTGSVTVVMIRSVSNLRGNAMKMSKVRAGVMFGAGFLTACAAFLLMPGRSLQAPVASGNDKFTMVTVPTMENGVPEAVFVLNHLTGVLAGGVLNEQTNTFTNTWLHNIAADFNNASTDPKYAIVSGLANLRSGAGIQPSFGIIYVAELSSGAVVAYAFQRPTTRNAGTTMPLVKLDFFKFADSVGQ
jgi:hypothetical protein